MIGGNIDINKTILEIKEYEKLSVHEKTYFSLKYKDKFGNIYGQLEN